jgi:hypothetical protein
MSVKWRARLRLERRLPRTTSMRWETIVDFEPLEQIAWRRDFGGWEDGVSIRSLDFDTYEDWQIWGPHVRAYATSRGG